MKNIKFILSVLILLFSLIDLGVTYGFNRYLLLNGIQYSAGNSLINDANLYSLLVPFMGVIFVFSGIAMLSLFIRKRTLPKIVCCLALTINTFLYIALYFEKMKYAHKPDFYFIVLQETLLVERLGLCLTAIWLLIEFYSVFIKSGNKTYELPVMSKISQPKTVLSRKRISA